MNAAAQQRDPLGDLESSTLNYDQNGLVPVVAQDVTSGAVLMVAWADREAIEATRRTGLAHFHSRSRGRLWRKGETSGHELRVVEAIADCDRDTLLLRVLPNGPACHRGTRTCFEPNAARLELGWLAAVIAERAKAPVAESYTARTLAKGLPRVAQKVGEEAIETVIAALSGGNSVPAASTASDATAPLVAETADLLYHLVLLLEATGTEPSAVANELARRHSERTRGDTSTGSGSSTEQVSPTGERP
ncbi:MAG TPA: bifunctional phosphoribosyl-AMP cyclohydrolase/phosphoribosyl-ATP diphosphatase HisIE [Thermoanaerobaculia bacterium]|nr:bifunctional phosphoribosyl-AMP cyclohydrolase/phosphoribosyl-ATP diphosphatase HisIE [Thermoanaerobaculia bacterium]